MRKLGTGLGVDPMAVYRHFRDQDELFDGVAEALFEEIDIEALGWDGTWRTVLEQFCRELRDALLRHPHAVPVFATRRTPCWASVDSGVRVARMLQADGFAPARSVHMVLCLREFTTGHALSQAVSRPVGGHLDPHEGRHFEVGLTAMLDGFEGLR
jgi:AcrR family transcriptional regulator